MTGTYIDIRFEGRRFSPKKLEKLTKIPLEILAEFGEISTFGRYKGKPLPYGLALLNIDNNSQGDLNSALDKYSTLLLSKKKELTKSGVENIVVDIETPPHIESAFSIQPEVVKKINQLKARIDFHTIDEDSDIEHVLSEVRSTVNSLTQSNYYSKPQAKKIERILSVKFKNATNQQQINTAIGAGMMASLIFLYITKYLNERERDIPTFEDAFKNVHV